ncbi:O-antigen ligase family protein [bacterium]|nr:O-antigen ligase family protein [bacterium]
MSSAFFSAFRDEPRSSALPFWWLAVLVAGLPLFVWPSAQDAFVLPKVGAFGAGTWILFGLILLAACLGRSLRILLHPVNGLLVLFLGWQLLSVLWAEAPAMAWDQVRSTGLLVLFALLAQSTLADDRRKIIALGWLLIVSSTAIAIWALILDFSSVFAPNLIPVRQTLNDWRDFVSAASLGNSGHVADFIVAGFLVTLGFALIARSKKALWLLAPCLWIQSAALIVAWSVHSNLSLIIAAGLLVFLMRDRWDLAWWRRRVPRLGVLMAGWIVVTLFFVVGNPANPHRSSEGGGIVAQAFDSSRWHEGGSTRLAIWATTLAIIQDNAWLGTGAGTFTWVYPATEAPLLEGHPELEIYAGTWTNAAHNTLLQTWSETGCIGAFLLISLIGTAFYAMNRRRQSEAHGNAALLSIAMAMLAAWCVQSMMNFPLELPLSSMLLVLLISIPAILPQRGEDADLLLPVSRQYPGIRLGIILKNMQIPTELQLAPTPPRAAAPIVGLVLAVAMLFPAWKSTAELRASVRYRPVYEQNRQLRGGSLTAPEAAGLVSGCRAALAIDPTYTDCRSALSDLLVRSQQYSAALAELELVQKRLNAIEVHLREAICLDALGRPDEALPAWNQVFTRQPQLSASFPGPFRRWASWIEAQQGTP